MQTNPTMTCHPHTTTTCRPANWLADIDRVFDAFFPAAGRRAPGNPEVVERDDAWLLHVDLPGFRKEDVKLTVERDTLALHATAADEQRPLRRPEVRRTWRLGEDIAVDRIGSKLEHGVLEITLPKRQPAAPAMRSIEVN